MWDENRYIGRNTSDNRVDTSNVTANRDGSLLERTEYLMSLITGDENYLQIAITTEDLQQSAGTYDLFTCSSQPVVVEKLIFALPNVNVSDDTNITYITVQTDHSTPQVIFNSTTGAKANLTAENQLSWDGAIYLGVGDKIQLTIAGGAADASTVCNIIAQYRAVVSGGSLTS